jgi:hypothetical protein
MCATKKRVMQGCGLSRYLFNSFINNFAEYADAAGASCPGNRSIKYFINDILESIDIRVDGLHSPAVRGLSIL